MLISVRNRLEMARWGDGEMARWGDGEMARWGDALFLDSWIHVR